MRDRQGTCQGRIYSAKQRGAALLTSLFVVVMLSLLSTSSLGVSLLQDRMTHAAAEMQVAMQVAESALLDAETRVAELEDTLDFGRKAGLFTRGTGPAVFKPQVWSADSSQSLAAEHALVSGAVGRYYVEELLEQDNQEIEPLNIRRYGEARALGPVKVFRIVAYGQGRTAAAKRWVSAHYAQRF